MLNGIASQLCLGFQVHQAVWREIEETASIIYGGLINEHARAEKVNFIWKSEEVDNILYRWQINDSEILGQLTLLCLRVKKISEEKAEVRNLVTIANNTYTNDIPISETEHVCNTLDSFVTAVFEEFPNVKADLQPLLDAGK